MSEHTPGPWTVMLRKSCHAIERESVAGQAGTRRLIARTNWWTPVEEQYANALLIAAAPDLLEAAKAMTEPAGEIAYRERWMALKAAIAKAEGR